MNTVSGAPAVEKSILVHVARVTSPKAVKPEVIDCSGADAYDVDKIFPIPKRWSDSDSDSDRASEGASTDLSEDASSELVSEWFLLEVTDSGLKISEIFDVPQEQPGIHLWHASCALIDSSLYVFGGMEYRVEVEESYGQQQYFRDIRRLDIRNKADGWMYCDSIKFSFTQDRAAVLGPYIYMFGPFHNFHARNRNAMTDSDYDSDEEIEDFAYVYDTIKQEGYFVSSPPAGDPDFVCGAEVWVPLEGRGMLVSRPSGTGKFSLHDPVHNRWLSCENYQPLPSRISGPQSVLNGILYICDISKALARRPGNYDLYSYNCCTGKLLYRIRLPKLVRNASKHSDVMSFCPNYLVSLSYSKLCLLWNSGGRLFCAYVSISSDPYPIAKLLGVRCFLGGIYDMSGSLPVDASQGQMMRSSKPLEKTREKMRLSEDMPFLLPKAAQLKVSSKTMNPFHTLPMFPISKCMLNRAQTIKVKGRRLMAQRLSRRKVSPKSVDACPELAPSAPSSNQSSDHLVTVSPPFKRFELRRHQDTKSMGKDLQKGQD